MLANNIKRYPQQHAIEYKKMEDALAEARSNYKKLKQKTDEQGKKLRATIQELANAKQFQKELVAMGERGLTRSNLISDERHTCNPKAVSHLLGRCLIPLITTRI